MHVRKLPLYVALVVYSTICRSLACAQRAHLKFCLPSLIGLETMWSRVVECPEWGDGSSSVVQRYNPNPPAKSIMRAYTYRPHACCLCICVLHTCSTSRPFNFKCIHMYNSGGEKERTRCTWRRIAFGDTQTCGRKTGVVLLMLLLNAAGYARRLLNFVKCLLFNLTIKRDRVWLFVCVFVGCTCVHLFVSKNLR